MATPGPGLEEIRDLMGLGIETPIQPGEGTTPGESVRERWSRLSNEERWRHVWNFRYMSADAAENARLTYGTGVVELVQPRVFRDGDQWCAMVGPNIQEGVVGWGTTAEEAVEAFRKVWGQTSDATKEKLK